MQSHFIGLSQSLLDLHSEQQPHILKLAEKGEKSSSMSVYNSTFTWQDIHLLLISELEYSIIRFNVNFLGQNNLLKGYLKVTYPNFISCWISQKKIVILLGHILLG